MPVVAQSESGRVSIPTRQSCFKAQLLHPQTMPSPPGFNLSSSGFKFCFHHNLTRSALTPRQWGPCPPTVTLLQLCSSHGTRSLEPSLCPFVDHILHIPRPLGPKWLPASMWASLLGPPLGGGSSFQRAHPMPDGWSRGSCVAQGQSLGCRLGCPWGGEVGEPCTLSFQPTQVRGGPALRPCPPVVCCI